MNNKESDWDLILTEEIDKQILLEIYQQIRKDAELENAFCEKLKKARVS